MFINFSYVFSLQVMTYAFLLQKDREKFAELINVKLITDNTFHLIFYLKVSRIPL